MKFVRVIPESWPAPLRRPGLASLALVLLFSTFFLSACGQTPPFIHQYVFEYAPPAALGGPQPLGEAIAVKRFAVAQAFNTTDMVYQPGPLQTAAYKYNRWRVNPGYMVADYLARDLRHSGLFQAVFRDPEAGPCRFVLEGGVEEIQERDEPEGWKAALALTVTLLDTAQEEIPRQILFQKQYRALEPMLAKTPQGLADAMSRAMQSLSLQITADVQRAIWNRLAEDRKK
jgi:ABC-type uncharacterized transport system auxiliary subunit